MTIPGMIRVAAAVPQVKPGDVQYNTQELLRLYQQASDSGTAIVLFPELCITGASCGDMFYSSILLHRTLEAVKQLRSATVGKRTAIIAGFPLCFRGRLYNLTGVFQNGNLILTGQKYPSNPRFYPASELKNATIREIEADFFQSVIFECGNCRFAVETGSDITSPLPPGAELAAAGAQLLLNPAAEAELTVLPRERKKHLESLSSRLRTDIITSGAGPGESGAEIIYGGRSQVFVNGKIIAENTPLQSESSIIFSDILPFLGETARMRNCSSALHYQDVATVNLDLLPESPDCTYLHLESNPFVPEDENELKIRCREILAISSSALARRISQVKAEKMVIGLSGGLDSTLAFLICIECAKLLKMPPDAVLAVTMPGFGTSERTRSNAEIMAELTGASLRVIPIADAVAGHFKDIGHDPSVCDLVYENSQARERTQILMDLANGCRGIVIGTGDLSEIALGWCTYNGDQMSMYAVNSSIPKTLMRHLVIFYAENTGGPLGKTLKDVVNTPVSPELLPGAQHTEKLIGSYDLHDFFLWHTVKNGASPEFLLTAAKHVFNGKFQEDELKNTLQLFWKRFHSQQFKRNPMPDGIKAGSFSLSPGKDWKSPSDGEIPFENVP